MVVFTFMEVWKKIKGFENYEVSNLGNVINKKTKKQLSKVKDKNGYYVVGLRNYSEIKIKKIHRLVAIAFIPNTEDKPTVNHKNAIKTDNYFKNLEWATRKEQAIHNVKLGLNNSFKRKVICLETNIIFESVVLAAKYYNINKITLTAKLNGNRKNNTKLRYA